MGMAQGLVAAIGVYLAPGLCFALPFAFAGAGRIDPAARRGTLGFRLLVVPGATVLWPLLAKRWWSASRRDDSAPGTPRS